MIVQSERTTELDKMDTGVRVKDVTMMNLTRSGNFHARCNHKCQAIPVS